MSPVGIVEAVYAAIGRRDLPALFGRLAPEVTLVQSAELPWGGVYRGHDGARAFLGKLTAHLASTVTVERIVSAGDHVAVTGWTEGKVNATGAGFRVPVVHVWQVREGLVVHVQFFIDHPAMQAALRAGKS